ncbi:MAG: hypothetical protein R3Y64_09280 [Peptostreptococcaceae bacterium]
MSRFLTNSSFFKSEGFRGGLSLYAHLLTKNKFSVTLNIKGESYTDGENVAVGIREGVLDTVTRGELVLMSKGIVAHEIEHINSTSFTEIKELVKKYQDIFKESARPNVIENIVRYIHNSVEDGRIEYLMSNKEPRTVIPLTFMRGHWWLENKVSSNDFNSTLFAICSKATTGKFPSGYELSGENYELVNSITSEINDFVKSSNEDAKDSFIKIMDKLEDWLRVNLEANEELSKKLEELLEDMAESEQNSSSQGSSKNSEEEEEGEGEESSDSGEEEEPSDEGDADSDSEDKNSKSEGEKSSNKIHENLDESKSDENMKDMLDELSKTAKDAVDNMDKRNKSKEIKDAAKKAKEEKSKKGSELSESDVKKIENKINSMEGNYVVVTEKHEVKPKTFNSLKYKKLKSDLDKILKSKIRQAVGNQRVGRLNPRSLHKVAFGDDKVFSRKQSGDPGDYVVYVLIDSSGSMHGNKYKNAMESCGLLEGALNGIAPVKIAKFNTGLANGFNTCQNAIIKDFSDTCAENKSFSQAYLNSKGVSGGVIEAYADGANHDAMSIEIAIQELNKRDERNKILFVLSDGLPAAHGISDRMSKEMVKRVVKNGRKDGIKIFNIMFGSALERNRLQEDFEFMYEKNIISCPTEEISKNLIKFMKRELK